MQRRVSLLDSEDVTENSQHQRKKERYCLLLGQTRRTALRGAKMMSECVRDAPSIGFLSHLMPTNFESWADIVAESLAHENEVGGDTRLERVQVLKCLLDGIKKVGWSWPGDTSKIDALQKSLHNWQSCLPTYLHLGNIPYYPYGEYFPVDTTPFGFDPPEISFRDPSIWESI
ncbi:hypothetical protein SERLA73DRAFT_175574 [Serpula lacrymans var. lacrymans S7.3]|uniref:Uncharacterized protein n=2 Tax=Serpula lacrymans var. lacrymans TaxID=341189 RepID=F8PKS2_SERL3|nr:uncharacterized protein SERLADRAFT_458095 [Serpula lacrymans var. lacrymans S7.9]EGO03881.1 hypothetical protein SERLA73DRAFT_175574 [Serpula lacrymans var. lacrymans S7.3]EGO29807.1 hypothetical protein SERLADRAFT_458095 [Serpula lacrymans var. lacrymans S7.9]